MTTRRSIPRGPWTPAIVLLLILAGCSSGSPASQAPGAATPTQPQGTAAGVPTNAPTSGVEACALLTPEEVSAAFGFTFDVGVPSADDLYAYCDYKSADGEEVKVFVTKTVAAASYFDTVKVNTGHAVSGVGDEAFWSTESFLPGLYFLTGGLMVYISDLSGSSSSEDYEVPVIQLGKLAASRV